MNIFVTDSNPYIAALNLDDKRVIKMILESTQLLCTAINLNGGKTIYKSTHIKHPCTIWVRQNRENWYWLWHHASALCILYSDIYNKEHKCRKILDDLIKTTEHLQYLPEGKLQTFVNCTTNRTKGLTFKHLNNPVEAYKAYLTARWNTDTRPPKWSFREKPKWYGGNNV